jgi:transposase
VAHRDWLQSQRFDLPSLQTTLETYIHYVEEAEQNMAEMDEQVEELAKRPCYQTRVRYLRCLKGIDTLSALTLIVEVQDFERFGKAAGFMSFTGLVSSEYSSGERVIRGKITRTGNAHIRRILVEAAWHARRPHTLSQALAERRRGCPHEVVDIARRAQRRLHRKYWRLMQRGKKPQIAAVACARELAGFVWAISRHFPTPAAA